MEILSTDIYAGILTVSFRVPSGPDDLENGLTAMSDGFTYRHWKFAITQRIGNHGRVRIGWNAAGAWATIDGLPYSYSHIKHAQSDIIAWIMAQTF